MFSSGCTIFVDAPGTFVSLLGKALLLSLIFELSPYAGNVGACSGLAVGSGTDEIGIGMPVAGIGARGRPSGTPAPPIVAPTDDGPGGMYIGGRICIYGGIMPG